MSVLPRERAQVLENTNDGKTFTGFGDARDAQTSQTKAVWCTSHVFEVGLNNATSWGASSGLHYQMASNRLCPSFNYRRSAKPQGGVGRDKPTARCAPICSNVARMAFLTALRHS